MTDSRVPLCSLTDLQSGQARGFRVGEGPWPLSGLVLRHGEGVRAYLNRCPHAGHPLNLKPHDFLDVEGRYIVCRSHGALFEPANGHCVAGPCAGKWLPRIPVEVSGDNVFLAGGITVEDYA